MTPCVRSGGFQVQGIGAAPGPTRNLQKAKHMIMHTCKQSRWYSPGKVRCGPPRHEMLENNTALLTYVDKTL